MTDGTRARRRPAISEQEKSLRRDEILTAAKKVFARNGFHATTIARHDYELITAGQAASTAQQVFRCAELTRAECSCIINRVSTSLGEAFTRI
jgi:hypothetical protein